MKYFVKYIETVKCPDDLPFLPSTQATRSRFFTTDDMEAEWQNFCSLHGSRLELVDITLLSAARKSAENYL